jgi:hypothetical protein
MWAILSEIYKMVCAVVAGFIKWCREHPKTAIAVFVLVVSNALMWHYGRVHQFKKDAVQITALKTEIKKANDETIARNTKIVQLETDSKKIADDASKSISESKRRMNATVQNYEKRLIAEHNKNQTVKVLDPTTQKSLNVEINPAGQVVCDRLHDSYIETINELVKEVNTK